MNSFAKKIILASNSPRRINILREYGYEFEIVKPLYREEKFDKFLPENIKKNSLGKALSVAQSIKCDAVVISADTVVILDSVCLLNKPRDENEAFSMLKSLSNKTHKVTTAISLVDSKNMSNLTEFCTTSVTFRKLSDDDIVKYINEKRPLDKAGSYGIQDFLNVNNYKNPPEKSFIKEIKGDFLNVVGFSIVTFENMLNNFKGLL